MIKNLISPILMVAIVGSLGCHFLQGMADRSQRYADENLEGADKPNIIVILTDDQGFADVAVYKSVSDILTPHLDQLAAGRLFTDAHSASSACPPSRYALLTGRYPVRAELFGSVFLRKKLVVDVDRTTIADLAKEQGNSTACIGKWYLAWVDKELVD